MLRRLLITAIVITPPLFAANPVPVEDAQARLAQRVAERHEPPTTQTTQPSELTMEQLRDENWKLRQEVAELRAEIKHLKEPRHFSKIEVGMPKTAFEEFLKNHRLVIHSLLTHEITPESADVLVAYSDIGAIEVRTRPMYIPYAGWRQEKREVYVRQSGSAVIRITNGVVVSITVRPEEH